MGKLIDGANFVDAFLAILSDKGKSYPREQPLGSGLKGRVADETLPVTVLDIVRQLREPDDIILAVHGVYCSLFAGDSSTYGNDLSAADFALIGHLLSRGLSIKDAELAMRASGRYRSKWDDLRGKETWLAYSIRRASANKEPVDDGKAEKDSYGDIHNARLLAQIFRGRLVHNVTKRKWHRSGTSAPETTKPDLVSWAKSLMHMVGRPGLEPGTNGLKVRCSTN